MPPVFLLALMLGSGTQRPDLAQLTQLAKNRDADGLTAFLDSKPTGRSPFQIIKTGGAYDVGKFGWTPLALDPVGFNRHFIVFSTALTSEDTGELLFEVLPGGLHFIPEEATFGVNVLHHNFDVQFQLATHGAILSDQFTINATRAGLAFFRMGPQYRVDSINGKKDFTQSGGVVALNLPEGKQTLNLAYHAIVNLPQYAASVTTEEATLTNDYWYPMIARQPAPYDITIHTPNDWTAVAQGELVSTRNSKDTEFKYHMALPVVYYSVTAGPFKPYSKQISGRRYSVWSQSMTDEQKEIQTEFYAPIIDFYSRTFCPIPFSGYGAVVSKSYGGGALEAYSFATYGTGWLPAEDAHEPSHTWWGGIIPNTYLHSFWNESFADFSMRLFERNVPLGNVDERRMAFISHAEVNTEWSASTVEDAGADIGRPADALGYGKGSFVLDALENEIGTDKMEATLRQWIKNTKPGDVGEWSGYEKAADEATGQDLTWFFDQWIRRPGAPDFTISNPAFDGRHVTLDLAFNGAPYRMTAEVLLSYQDGSEELKRVAIPASATSTLTVDAKEKPIVVSFDPYRRLIRRLDASEAPPTIRGAWGGYTHYIFSDTKSALSKGAGSAGSSLPTNLAGTAVIGMPGDSPVIATLAEKAGFTLNGTKLTYDGTTVDLTQSAAMALIDLGGGKHCLLALGEPVMPPNTGDAYIAVTDRLGRFLRGKTLPKTSGRFVFKF